MIKGIIYDMDDLMVDSDPLHSLAWNETLNKYGYNFSDIPEDVRSSFIGRKAVDFSKAMVGYFKMDLDYKSFYQEKYRTFLKLVKERLEPMPGLIKSLTLFKKNNYKIALATSGSKEYVDIVMERFQIRSYFDDIISGDDVKIGKPNPESYLLSSKKLGLKTSECLVLEDATKGIESAKSAGCKCIAIRNLHTPPQDHSKADMILDSLNDITIEIVNSL